MRTLRARIALGFTALALATLLGVGGGLFVVLRDLHREADSAALADLLVPYLTQARQQLAAVANGEVGAVRRFLDETRADVQAAGATILLARADGSVLAVGPGGAFAAVRLELDTGTERGDLVRGVVDVRGRGRYVYAASTIFGDRLPGGARTLVLARPDDSGALAMGDVLRALGVAAVVVLAVGIPIAWLLARSVGRPLRRLASASAVVARGGIPEPVPTTGPEEVARAAGAFNAMAAEVAAAREEQRRLLADIRHDLRTPLTAIRGFAEALGDGTARGDGAQRATTAIRDEALRLERMVEDLRDLSGVETGTAALHIESLDARDLVRRTADRLAASARDRGQEIGVRGASAPLPFAGDRGALARILDNLCVNATAHAPSPGGHVWLEAEPFPMGGVVIAVRDDGPGIPPDALPHVFERLCRADPSRSGQGSGLGLAIVAELARAHGGRAFAENVPGGGARVGVVLPARITSAPAPARRVHAPAQGRAS